MYGEVTVDDPHGWSVASLRTVRLSMPPATETLFGLLV